jgi:hypothetical protein
MGLASCSHWLEQLTQPGHPYYHPIQVSLLASISYVSTACLTAISPTRGMTVMILAYAVSQLISPLFCQLFGLYEEVPLIPFMGQALQIATSFIVAKVICQLAGQALSFKELRQVGVVFLVSLYVSRLALRKFRQQIIKNYF